MKWVEDFMQAIHDRTLMANRSVWEKRINWKALPENEKTVLFAQLEKIKDEPVVNSAFQFLYQVMNSEGRLRILALGVQSRQYSIEQKRKFLEKFGEILKGEYSSSVENEQLRCFWADLKALEARIEEEAGNLNTAIKLGKEAAREYHECGAVQRAKVLMSSVNEWEKWLQERRFVVSIEQLRDERVRLSQELGEFQQRTQAEILKRQNELEQLMQQKETLEQEVKCLCEQIDQIKDQIQEQQQRLQKLNKLIAEYQPVAGFLQHASKLTEAPLWVEIIRLANQQGEIDDLTLMALERLANAFPQQGLSLLQETLARGIQSDVADGYYSLVQKYAPFLEGLARLPELIHENPKLAASHICEVWEHFIESK